jgi:uncharacterized protein YwqG
MKNLKSEQIDSFAKLLANSKIAIHSGFLLKHIRPAVDVIWDKNAETYPACSRFGGTPDLPIGTEFPAYEVNGKVYPYRFIGQINFADIPPVKTGLPNSGLLSLFAADYIGDDGLWCRDDEYVYAIYITDLANLENVNPPPDYPFTTASAVVKKFQPTIDIPFDEFQVENFPISYDRDDEYDEYHEIRNSLHGYNYLLGYPSYCSLAYNPTPEGEWISLLTLASDDDLEWCWHDGGSLMIFIKKEDLQNLNFNNLTAEAG